MILCVLVGSFAREPLIFSETHQIVNCPALAANLRRWIRRLPRARPVYRHLEKNEGIGPSSIDREDLEGLRSISVLAQMIFNQAKWEGEPDPPPAFMLFASSGLTLAKSVEARLQRFTPSTEIELDGKDSNEVLIEVAADLLEAMDLVSYAERMAATDLRSAASGFSPSISTRGELQRIVRKAADGKAKTGGINKTDQEYGWARQIVRIEINLLGKIPRNKMHEVALRIKKMKIDIVWAQATLRDEKTENIKKRKKSRLEARAETRSRMLEIGAKLPNDKAVYDWVRALEKERRS